MEMIITFIEGIITFISPCMLPMVPIYITFIAGGTDNENKKTSKMILNALGFVLGFTVIFVTLGAFAGIVGSILLEYKKVISVVSGIIMIVFGLHYMNVIKLPFIDKVKKMNYKPKINGEFLSSFLFGLIFAIGWSPCVGMFLGSALALATQSATVLKGILLLLMFSLGLGIPFIFTAAILGEVNVSFSFIKKNYEIINTISGLMLVAVGILMITGLFEKIIMFFAR